MDVRETTSTLYGNDSWYNSGLGLDENAPLPLDNNLADGDQYLFDGRNYMIQNDSNKYRPSPSSCNVLSGPTSVLDTYLSLNNDIIGTADNPFVMSTSDPEGDFKITGDIQLSVVQTVDDGVSRQNLAWFDQSAWGMNDGVENKYVWRRHRLS